MEKFNDYLAGDSNIKDAFLKIEQLGLSLKFKTASVEILNNNGSLCAELYNKAQILHFVSGLGNTSTPVKPTRPTERTRSKVAELEHKLIAERELRQKLVRQYDIIEARLKLAQEQLKQRQSKNDLTDNRYSKLKTYLAKQLHPDHFRGSEIERMFRTEIFKLVWTKIEEIEK